MQNTQDTHKEKAPNPKQISNNNFQILISKIHINPRINEISICLYCGKSTLSKIKLHIRNIYHKLEVNSIGEVISKAMKKNLT